MQTSRYDFTEFDTWAKKKPEMQEYANAMKRAVNDGIEPGKLANALLWFYGLTPSEQDRYISEWEQAIREKESIN
jgi:hypothetical protein